MPKNIFLINFDYDNTLAPLAKPMYPQAIEKITKLVSDGHIVTINTGKPVYYMVGVCREAGLQDIWLIGENGCDICYGVSLPLRKPFNHSAKPESLRFLQEIKSELINIFGNRLWFEPKIVALSPFFDTPETQEELQQYLDARKATFSEYDINIFPHEDCFDLVPDGIDKSTGIKTLQKHFSIPVDKTIAIGDTWNDVPMFEACGHSIVINFPELQLKSSNHISHVNDIDEALEKLDSII